MCAWSLVLFQKPTAFVFGRNNAGEDGGAVRVQGSWLLIQNSIFQDNSARRFGGVVAANVLVAHIINSQFINNTAIEGYVMCNLLCFLFDHSSGVQSTMSYQDPI